MSDAMQVGDDPADYKVEQVVEHLATAEPEERQRVLAAEAKGKARKGILEPSPGVATLMSLPEDAEPVEGHREGTWAMLLDSEGNPVTHGGAVYAVPVR